MRKLYAAIFRSLSEINTTHKGLAKLFSVLLILVFSQQSFGQRTWDGSHNTNWSDYRNWSGDAVPLSTDDVIIPNGGTRQPTVNIAAVCKTLTINGGNNANTLTISGTNSLTVSGAVNIGAGTGSGDNKIIAVGGGTFSAASVAVTAAGNANRSSGITLSTGTVNVSGNITMGDANDDFTFTGAGTLNIGGNFTGGTFTPSTGTVNCNGSMAQTFGSTSPYNFYNFTVNKSTTANTVTSNGNAFQVANKLTVTQGNLILQATNADYGITNDLIVSTNGTLTHSVNWDATGKSIKVSGSIAIDGIFTYTTRSTVWMIGSGSETVKTGTNASSAFSIFLLNNGNFSANGTVKINDNFWPMFGSSGSFHTNGQSVTANAAVLINGGTVYVDGGTLNVTGGIQVGYTGGIASAINLSSGTLNTDGLVIGATAPITATATHSGGTANINGSLTINSTGTYTCSGTPAINISGDWTNNGSFTPASSTVTFNNTGASQTVSGSAANPAFNNIVIAKGGQSLNVAGGALTNLNINGNWTNNGGTFAPSTGRVTFNGSAPQQIIGPTVTSFNNLTLNNSVGLSLNAIDANINGGAAALTFSNGKINTGANKLILGNSATTSGAGAGKYVNGNLEMGIANGTTARTFDIGDASNYTPVALTLAGVSNGTGSLTAFTVGSEHPNIATAMIDETQDVNRYYSLVNNGVALTSYNPTFNFVSGDIDAGATPANFVVGLYNAGWTYPTVGTKTGTSTQATGVNNFGTFAIGVAATEPTMNMQPSDITSCDGTSVSFTAKANSKPVSAAVWQISTDGGSNFTNLTLSSPYSVNTSSASGITTSVLTVNPSAIGLNGYQYRVIFTNSKGSITSQAAILTVDAKPTAVAGGSQTICVNGTATVPVGAATATNGTILWTENGAGSITSGDNTLTPVYTAAAGDAGNTVTLTMTVTSNNTCGSATASAIYTVIVNALPTASAGGSQTICQNGTATVTGASSSNGTIVWTHDGAGSITSGQGTPTPTYTAAPGDAGNTVTLTMTVTSNNACGSATASATYTVIVNALPTASAVGSQTICVNGTAAIPAGAATATNGMIVWTHNGTGTLADANSLTPVYTPAAGDAGNTVTLTMTVSNSPCAAATATFTVNVDGLPTATAGGSQTICVNSTATVSGATAANGTIVWTHDGMGTLTDANSLTPTYTPAAGDAGNTVTLTMTVTGNNTCGGTATATYTVNVDGLPTATAGGSQAICQTGTVTVSGASASNGTIAWTENGAGSITGANTLTPTYTVAPGDAGNTVTLTMTVTSNNACTPVTATADYTIIVNARPTATITSGNTAICNPGTTNITGTVIAIGAWTITLSDGSTATGTGSGNFSIAVSPATTTTYTISSLSDANCTSVAGDLTGSTTVTVYQPVVITTQPVSPGDVCASTNSPRSFTVTATGDILSYQWYKDGNPITGATAATYTIANPVGTDAGTYYVVVKGESPCTSVQSASVGFVVNQPITISAISPATSTLCEGGTATFSVTASGSISNYFWRQNGSALTNGGNISGANTNILTINPVTAANAGNYSLIINGTDDVCPQAITAVDAVLNVSVKSANPTSATASSTQICNGSSTTLTLNGGGGGTGEVIHWHTGANGTGTTVGAGNGITVSPATTTTYYGRYEDGSPCNFNSADASVTITVDPVSVGGTASMTNPKVCYNSAPANDITLSGNVGAIQWQKSTTLSFTSPIDIVAATTNTLTTSQIGVLTTTTYFRAVVKSGVCGVAYSNIITITVNSLPTVASVTPNTSCGTDNVTLSATASAGATIDWFTSATGGSPVGTGLTFTTNITATTTFYAEASNTATGCISVGRTPVVATFKPKPDAQISVTPQTICSESTIATINITNPNATPSTTFSWTRNNATNVTGIANGSGTAISGALTNTTNTQQKTMFTVTPTANGCSGTPVTATVIVNPKPTIAVTSAPTAVCYNTQIAINYTNPNNVSGTVLSWTRNNPAGVQAGPATSGNGNISQTLVNTTTGNVTVIYTLKVKNPAALGGCETTVSVPVVLYAKLVESVEIGNSQTVCNLVYPAQLLIKSTVYGGDGNYQYQWQRSETGTGSWQNVGNNSPVYSPDQIVDIPIIAPYPTYYYRLTITDGCGSSVTSVNSTIITPMWNDITLGGSVQNSATEMCSGSTLNYTVETGNLGSYFDGTLTFGWYSDNPLVVQSGTISFERLTREVCIPILWWEYCYDEIFYKAIGSVIVQNTTLKDITTTINIVPNNGTCDFSPYKIPITVHPVPKMTATPSNSIICSGTSLNAVLKGLITDAPTSFTWTATLTQGNAIGFTSSNSGNVAAGSSYNLIQNITNTGTGQAKVHYKITPYSNGCEGNPVEFDITINPEITAGAITGPASVCYNDKPTLSTQTAATAAGAITYQWQSNTTGCTGTFTDISGATSENYTPAAGLTTTTYFRRVATTTYGGITCTAITPCITVVVNPQLPVSVSITNTTATTVCAGTSISFLASPSNGGSTPSYQWKVNGIDAGGPTSSNTFSSSTLATGDKVTVELTSYAAPCAIGTPALSNEIGVTVNPILPVSVAISATLPTTVCASTAISFEATPTNPGTAPAYQWYINGTAVSGANGTTFSSTTLNNGDKVSVGLNSSANLCATGNPAMSSEITVTVNPILNVAVSISADKNNICAGTEVKFTATPTYEGTAPVYQWKLNGVNVGTNSDTYTSSTLNDNDKITCVLTSDVSPCGQGSPATSNEITINIKPDAIAGTITAPSGGTNLCVGGTSYTYVVTGNNATGTWSNADANGVFSVDASGKVTAVKAGTAHLRYTVTTDCSTDYEEILLTVGATPAKPSAITGSVEVCSGTGSGLVYSVENVPGLTYHWAVPADWTFSGNGTHEITITSNPPASGNISVTATTTIYTCGTSPASTITVNVVSGRWLGITSDWNNASNWCGGIPTTTTNVTIPATGPQAPYYFPIITGTGDVHNLNLAAGASVTIQSGGVFNVSGDISGPGKIDATQGTIEFNGTATQQISSGMFKDTTIASLKVSNAAGLQVVGDAGGKSLAITDSISFDPAKGKLDGGGNITLKSTYDKTASLGVVGANNTVTGDFTVERYINIGTDAARGQHPKSWLMVATPTEGQTIRESWMEGGSTPTGYGTNMTSPDGTGAGWDAYSPSPSLKDFNENTNLWKRATAADTTPLFNPKGWMVFVRGDRHVTAVGQNPTPTTLRSKGRLKTGNVPFTILADPSKTFFISIGNPYASAVDMRKALPASVNSFHVWNPYLVGDYGLGAYQVYTRFHPGDDFKLVPSGSDVINNFLLSGQAFFVQRNETAATITFTENAKGDTTANTTYFRPMGATTGSAALLYSNIFRGDKLQDGTLQIFGNEYSNSLDNQDARKMLNTGINLSIKVADRLLVVERRQPFASTDTIFYNLTGAANGKYNFSFKPQNIAVSGLEAWLEDSYTKERTPVGLDVATEVNFEVTADAASKAANRFMMVFKTVPQPASFLKIEAINDGNAVDVKWAVKQEVNVEKYVVMYSADGVNFTDLAEVDATGINEYMTVHRSPVDGYNYYRVRSIDIFGVPTYSDIAKVFVGSAEPSLRVFPNPVQNGVIQLRLKNYPEGKYMIRLLNPAGQLMLAKTFHHGGGNGTEKIPWDFRMAHGNYHLEVRHPDGSVKVILIMW